MVGSTLNKVTYTISDDSEDPNPIPFRYDDEDWIQVVAFAAEGGAVENLIFGVDYTLAGDGVGIAGTLTLEASYLAGVATGTKLVIYRIAPALQTLDLEYNSRFPAEQVEAALDWLAMASIDRSNTLQRTITFPYSDPDSYTTNYASPSASERAGTIFGGSDSTDTPGLPVWLTYEEAASKLFQYADLGNLGSTVLAAISAIAPVSVFADPTSATGNKKLGQLAIRPYGVTSMVIQGTDFVSPVDCPIYDEVNGYPRYWDGESPGWVIVRQNIGSGFKWMIGAGTPADSELAYQSDNDAALPDLASWINTAGAAEVVTGDDVPAKIWINTRADDIDPVWEEVITRNSFLNLPTTNPGLSGAFFRTSTTILNVSQG